jgi:hypothetical protein
VACGDARVIQPADAVATRAYVNARSRLIQATKNGLPVIGQSGEVFVMHSIRECPDIAATIPHSAGFDVMNVEATRAPAAVMRQTNRVAISKFDHTVAKLRWSDPQLTSLVHHMASAGELAGTVGVPDLCGDLSQWSRSRYQTVPLSTTRYNRRTAALGRLEARSKETAADWWLEHLAANQRGICGQFSRARHQAGYFTVCSGGLSEPDALAHKRRLIMESKSVGDAIWKLLEPYEDSGMHSLSHAVELSEANVQTELNHTYYGLVAQLSRSLRVSTILLPTELGLLGLPGVI